MPNLNIPYRFICALIGVILIGFPLYAAVADSNVDKNTGIVLIVASYNPDTRRMSEFISDFERQIIKKKYGYKVLIEDMGCKGIDEAIQWNSKLKELLSRYKRDDLKAVILLGQEAWATFMLQEDFPKDIPFFACFASRNGIVLPVDTTINTATWSPESVDMEVWAKEKGMTGGVLNVYDVKKNIDLIKNLYPDTENIAFVSDNTYGGLSLQALVKKEMKQFPELNLITIDSREISTDNVSKFISKLPNHTALLLGTWRVDRDGMYFLNSAVNTLLSSKSIVPTFSLTGTGLSGVAIGGYVPVYRVDATIIADQIYDYYMNKIDSTFFVALDGEYQFDQQQISKMGIEEYQLPHKSKIINKTEDQLRKYQLYIIWALVAVICLTLLTAGMFRLYYRNKKLKDSLIENEKQLIIAKENAEESGRLKSAFLANMSHEIRTPLNAIVGFSTLLCDESIPDESKDEFRQIIMTNSNLLLTLINDVLDISRLDTGKVVFNLQNEDIDAICRQVISTTGHLQKVGIEYNYKPSHESFVINTDMQRLSQVLINLFTNATKFTESGNITIGYDVKENENMVYFYVEDSGYGIPSEMRSKVFSRFEKLNEHKQGTGLGLSICEQIITRLGGRIWVDPDYNNGSRFVFTHPINR